MRYTELFSAAGEKVSLLFGDEVSLSWPMPDIWAAQRVERFFLYPAQGPLRRMRPFGSAVFSSDSGLLLAYQDLRLRDFMGEGHPFSEPISYALPAGTDTGLLSTRRSLLSKLYEEVRGFAFAARLDDGQKDTLRRYWALLLAVTPEALRPYYQKMGKNFYRWGYLHV